MNINDNTQTTFTKFVIDFGSITDEEFTILCSTSYALQGKSCATNHRYVPYSKAKNSKALRRVRTGSQFEFPAQAFIDEWLKHLTSYIKGV